MQIANIYPIANQAMYKNERYVMILAHLVKKGLYKPESFNANQYIIMDNGLFEGEQVSTNLEDLIKLVEKSGIPVNEIIVPDVVNDAVRTKKLFKENLETVKKYGRRYKFMFVAQSRTYQELRNNILFINQYADHNLNLSVGISKLSPLDRADIKARKCYEHCKFPIHILGIKDSFDELQRLKNVPQIRGCDTSQLAFIAKNEGRVPIFLWEYSRSMRKEYHKEKGLDVKNMDIQLEHDMCDMDLLKKLKEAFDSEVNFYGFL